MKIAISLMALLLVACGGNDEQHNQSPDRGWGVEDTLARPTMRMVLTDQPSATPTRTPEPTEFAYPTDTGDTRLRTIQRDATVEELAVSVVDTIDGDPSSDRGPTGLQQRFAQVEVRHDGCASDGTCYWYNFYWAPTREAVLQPDQSLVKEMHEICHAEQHVQIGRPLSPSEYDLHPWYSTPSGLAWVAAVGDSPWGSYTLTPSPLEDWAQSCAWYWVQPEMLRNLDAVRYREMETHFD